MPRPGESRVRVLYLRRSTRKSRPAGDDANGSLSENRPMSPTEFRRALMDVARERLRGERVGLSTAVTQLATLYGQLYGRRLG